MDSLVSDTRRKLVRRPSEVTGVVRARLRPVIVTVVMFWVLPVLRLSEVGTGGTVDL